MKISLKQLALFSFYKILLQYSQFFQNKSTNTHINTSIGIMKMSKISKRYLSILMLFQNSSEKEVFLQLILYF